MSTLADAIVEEGASALGAFPGAYQQLSRVLADPSANAERIAAAVRVDPSLTARLLQFVNSPAVSPGRHILSVSHAAMLVGRSQLRDLAKASAVVHMFRGIPEHLIDMNAFWRHSIAVGIATTSLAMAAGRPEPSWFVPGLLHDIGALLVYLVRPNEARHILIETENRGLESREVEREHLGADHGELGARLQQAWGLPELSIEVARHHHEPSLAPADVRDAVDFVHLADVAVSALQVGNGGERAAHALDDAAWTRAGLHPDRTYDALSDLADHVDAIAFALA